jgi:hypothetical protein
VFLADTFSQCVKYRGYEWEKFGAFCERMLNKHPRAQLLKTPGDPPVDIRYGNDKYIQCTPAAPEPDRTLSVFTNPDVPLAVRTYYEHRFVQNLSFNYRRLIPLEVLSICSPLPVKRVR